MIKVEKTSLIEMNVEFKEIFDGATIEEATQKHTIRNRLKMTQK